MKRPEPKFDRWTQRPQSLAFPRLATTGSGFLSCLGCVQAALIAQKDAVRPLIGVIAACAMNVAGDVVLITQLGWGLVGAAIATLASQSIHALVLVLLLHRRGEVRSCVNAFLFSRSLESLDLEGKEEGWAPCVTRPLEVFSLILKHTLYEASCSACAIVHVLSVKVAWPGAGHRQISSPVPNEVGGLSSLNLDRPELAAHLSGDNQIASA